MRLRGRADRQVAGVPGRAERPALSVPGIRRAPARSGQGGRAGRPSRWRAPIRAASATRPVLRSAASRRSAIRSAIAAFADEALLAYDRVWAAAGAHDAVFAAEPAALIKAAGATTADLAVSEMRRLFGFSGPGTAGPAPRIRRRNDCRRRLTCVTAFRDVSWYALCPRRRLMETTVGRRQRLPDMSQPLPSVSAPLDRHLERGSQTRRHQREKPGALLQLLGKKRKGERKVSAPNDADQHDRKLPLRSARSMIEAMSVASLCGVRLDQK